MVILEAACSDCGQVLKLTEAAEVDHAQCREAMKNGEGLVCGLCLFESMDMPEILALIEKRIVIEQD